MDSRVRDNYILVKMDSRKLYFSDKGCATTTAGKIRCTCWWGEGGGAIDPSSYLLGPCPVGKFVRVVAGWVSSYLPPLATHSPPSIACWGEGGLGNLIH